MRRLALHDQKKDLGEAFALLIPKDDDPLPRRMQLPPEMGYAGMGIHLSILGDIYFGTAYKAASSFLKEIVT